MNKLIVAISLWLIASFPNLNAADNPCDLDCGTYKQELEFSNDIPLLYETSSIKLYLNVKYIIQKCNDESFNIQISDISINQLINGDINNLEIELVQKFLIEYALQNLTSFTGNNQARVKVPCYEKNSSGINECVNKSCCDLIFEYQKDASGVTSINRVEGDCVNPSPNDFNIGSPIQFYNSCSNYCYWQTDGNDESELPHPRDHFIGPTNGSDFIFKTGGQLANNTNKERMRLTAEGNLGLGIQDPSSKLGVAGDAKILGTVYANELIIEDTEIFWPDYVFDKNYKRLSLEEIEDYISINGHLPNIPSQKHIAENGIRLKEMNLLMMEKIEELTLELIDLNKELEKLRQEVE